LYLQVFCQLQLHQKIYNSKQVVGNRTQQRQQQQKQQQLDAELSLKKDTCLNGNSNP